jgi:hypothetical protein
VRRIRITVLTWASSLAASATARADAPTIAPNNSIPGTAEFAKLAGGMMTVGLIAAALGFLVALGGMGLAGHSQNVHLRERFKTGAGVSLLGTVAFGAANRLLAWAWNIGAGF